MSNDMKKIITFVAAFMMMAAMSITAFAGNGQWLSDATGWWWSYNDGAGGYPVNQWLWIDGNNDGVSECYYFGPDGYMLANTTTPDGYQVNENGAWVQDGVVKSHNFIPDLDQRYAPLSELKGGEVTDPYSVSKITADESLIKMMSSTPYVGTDIPEGFTIGEKLYDEPMMPLAKSAWYEMSYKGITFKGLKSGVTPAISILFGPAKLFFNNIPEQGIEVNTFFENSGFVDGWSDNMHIHGTTGLMSYYFDNPSIRAANIQLADHEVSIDIELTQGADGNYYIYPDSRALYG